MDPSKARLVEGPVGRQLVGMTLPMLLGIATMMGQAFIDTWFIGQVGDRELAAYGFGFPILMIITSVAIGLGAGTSSVVARAKHLCGLQHVGRRLIGRLSKGYQQRVGIAQAILHEPNIVILDEPTVGLDPIQVREIRDLIRDIGQDRGVILSTHILAEVQSVCNRVQIINEGELVFSDQLDSLHDAQQPEHHIAALRGMPSLADL